MGAKTEPCQWLYEPLWTLNRFQPAGLLDDLLKSTNGERCALNNLSHQTLWQMTHQNQMIPRSRTWSLIQSMSWWWQSIARESAFSRPMQSRDRSDPSTCTTQRVARWAFFWVKISCSILALLTRLKQSRRNFNFESHVACHRMIWIRPEFVIPLGQQ